MSFDFKKCKNEYSPLAMLPFVSFNYSLGSNIISYADIERDLWKVDNKNQATY